MLPNYEWRCPKCDRLFTPSESYATKHTCPGTTCKKETLANAKDDNPRVDLDDDKPPPVILRPRGSGSTEGPAKGRSRSHPAPRDVLGWGAKAVLKSGRIARVAAST